MKTTTQRRPKFAIHKVVSWHYTLKSARYEARLRQMSILEVIQPKGKKPLYAFGRKNAKRYYVVTSAPNTVVREFAKIGVKTKLLKSPSRSALRPNRLT